MAPNNIAVWSIYSRDQLGVQISTTFGQLNQAVQNFCASNSFAQAYTLPPNDNRELFFPPDIEPVQYASIENIVDDLKQRWDSYSNALEGAADITTELIRKLWGEHFEPPIVAARSANLLKDERFAHEEEVRAVFRMTKRNEQEIEEWRSQPFSVLGFPTRLPRKNEAPGNVYIPVASGFVHSVMLDPRAPIWRVKSMTQMLRKYGLDPSVSPVFGYIFEEDKIHLPEN